MLKTYYNKLTTFIQGNSLLKKIAILGSSTGIAQLFPILTAPLLTRLYSPEDFGVFGLFYSIVTVLSVIAMLRYESIVIVGKNHEEALYGLVTCILLAIGISCLVLGICWTYAYPIAHFFKLDRLQYYLILMAPCLLAMALYYPLGDWFIRNERFLQQGKIKIVLFCSLSLIQLAFGFLGLGAVGLILGYVFAYSLVDIILLTLLWKKDNELLKKYRLSNGWQIMKTHKRFFYINLPSGIINNLAVRIPNFFIAPYFGEAALGFFSLGERIINVSLAFVSSAITDVYRQEASKEFRETGTCKKTYRSTLKILLYTGVPLLLLFVFFSPLVFSFVFGIKWLEAGQYIQVLAFWIIIRYVAAPLSYTFIITNRQEIDIIWQTGLLIISSLAFYFGKTWFNSAIFTLIIFCISTFAYYSLNIFLSYRLTRSSNIEHGSHH